MKETEKEIKCVGWQKGKPTFSPDPKCIDFLVKYEAAITTSFGFQFWHSY